MTRLHRIERDIAQHRRLYLEATWAGHQGEADWHETKIDQLLNEWSTVNRGTTIPR